MTDISTSAEANFSDAVAIPKMATVQELDSLARMITERTKEAAAEQAQTNAATTRTLVDRQTEGTKQIMDALIQLMKTATDATTNNDRKKVLTRNLIKPKRFMIPTKVISIACFLKQYREFIDSSCGDEEGAYAKYLRPFLDGQAADWYDAHVDGNMADDFDAITEGLKKRFERESYIASSYIPLQEEKTVTEFYDNLVQIATAQKRSNEKELHLFRTGIADKYLSTFQLLLRLPFQDIVRFQSGITNTNKRHLSYT